MSTIPKTGERRGRPWVERYRELRRRVERLEAMYEDRETLANIMATGRYFKLAYATARAYEQIEKEFAWATEDGAD
ncbi:MAG TPA: hypothetical protein P5256_13020 [Beijerinckiaceae bacterium]|nr:hypothetical protein [Rhodoblastus sp.]MCB9998469.1 hypothetical protein [Methylobacteriaceae bacterium]MCC2099779.1 hypothetical protein [Hyphomicrobiales bacterium]HRY04046.1 hypothetical protein [Beijerinckiaceae bacterium]MCC2108240.1 hypothetical protein [Hyphomicrobiales bacterium]